MLDNLNPLAAGETFVFLTLAATAVAMAVMTVTRRNPVAAVMSLVGTFIALAGIYAMLSAHFLAIIQVLVYAGAIMVLFIFVVMILNRDELSPVSWRGILSRSAGVVAGLWAFAFIAMVMVRATRGDSTFGTPPEVGPQFGTVASIGRGLFTEFVFPFEAISILLLVAIVGGLVVSRSHKQEEHAAEAAERVKKIRTLIVHEGAGGGEAADTHGDHDADAGHGTAHGAH